MVSMSRVALLFIATSLLPRASGVLSDIIIPGRLYLMSSENTGDDYYLGCGGDSICSLIAIASAHAHDGWKAIDHGSGTWGLQSDIDHDWCFDVQATGVDVFANSQITNTLGQQWALYSWPDGTCLIYNQFWKGNLDVKNAAEPFINTQTGDTSSLNGQRWYFRSIDPLLP